MTRDVDALSPAAGKRVFRPWARRRIRLAGLVCGPLSAAGWGVGVYAVMTLGESGVTLAGHTLRFAFSLLLLVSAWLVSRRLLRRVHRNTRITVFGMLLSGLPLAPLARGIALIAALQIMGFGTVTAQGQFAVWLVLAGTLAIAGVLSGLLAWSFVGSMSAAMPEGLRGDEQAVKLHRESTVRHR